jgi:WhiB family redox-sensing transcriptional regulator
MKANEKDKEVGAMTVLYSELQVEGWADQFIGLEDVTYTSDNAKAFTLPCHNADPELFFSDSDLEINLAKSLCGSCPMKNACLEGALDRGEPVGVWGGQLIEDGVIIERKRRPGRPPRQVIAA